RRHEDQRRGRQQPLGAPCVEPGQRDPARTLHLAHEQAGDQVPGDDEEHVDTDVPARQERHVRVVQQHQPDRDRPEPLDVGAEGAAGSGPPGGGWRCRRRCGRTRHRRCTVFPVAAPRVSKNRLDAWARASTSYERWFCTSTTRSASATAWSRSATRVRLVEATCHSSTDGSWNATFAPWASSAAPSGRAGDSRWSAMSGLYVTPSSRTVEPRSDLLSSLSRSWIRRATYDGIVALISWASSTKRNG